MKTNISLTRWITLLALAVVSLPAATGFSQGTAFSYQGRFYDGSSPANGLYDLRFMVWDAPTNGSVVAGPLTNSATGITNGLFAVALDFGSGVFTGPDRWLQLEARTNGGDLFTPILPRQPFLSVPYAMMAGSASNLLGTLPATQLSGSVSNISNLYLPPTTTANAGVIYAGNRTLINDYGDVNFFAGVGAGNLAMSGEANTGLGYQALQANSSGSANTAVGLDALGANTTGYGNTAIGLGALMNNGSGNNNIALGEYAGYNNNGNYNIDIGNRGSGWDTNIIRIGDTQTQTYIAGVINGNGAGLTNINISSLTGNSFTLGGTNGVAPLTVPPTLPAAATGGVGRGNGPDSIAVAGNYAYMVSYDNSKLMVFDVSIPSAPVSVSVVGTSGGSDSIAVAGRYAYVANYDAGRLQIFDISVPMAPVSVISTSCGGKPTSLAMAGHYVYLVNYDSSTLQIMDVSAPTAPISVRSQVTDGHPWSVAVAGRYVYVANYGANTLEVFDISTPATAFKVGSVPTDGGPYSVAVAGRYAYVANYGSNTLQVFDVSQVSVGSPPVLAGSVGTGSEPHAVAVAGRYAYVVNAGNNTLQLFDVSTPSAPVRVGSVGTGSMPNSVAVAGRYAYVVNWGGDVDLQVFDLGGAYIQQLEAGALETGTLQTRDTATVGNNLDVRGGLTVSASARISGGLSVDNGTISAMNFVGNGSGLTGLNAASLSGSISNFNNIYLPVEGIIYSGEDTLIHRDESGDFFAGPSAGNLRIQLDESWSNTGIGANALQLITGGIENTAVGDGALKFMFAGDWNTAIGAGALAAGDGPETGYFFHNTAVGNKALNTDLTGNCNTAIGSSSLLNATGNYNIALGNAAGGQITNGSYNIEIGNGGSASDDHVIRIGDVQTQTYIAGVIHGDGSGLTNVTGTLTGNGATNANIPNTIVRRDASGNFSAGAITGTSVSGNGTGLSNVNADQLDSLHASAFAQLNSSPTFNGSITASGLTVNGEATVTAINITSDRNAKEEFAAVQPRDVLEKVAHLPISAWQYKSQPGVRHIGPMAQDFREAFGMGRDEKHITTVDADGVALAAIQGLNELMKERDAELAQLRADNKILSERLAALENIISTGGVQPAEAKH